MKRGHRITRHTCTQGCMFFWYANARLPERRCALPQMRLMRKCAQTCWPGNAGSARADAPLQSGLQPAAAGRCAQRCLGVMGQAPGGLQGPQLPVSVMPMHAQISTANGIEQPLSNAMADVSRAVQALHALLAWLHAAS